MFHSSSRLFGISPSWRASVRLIIVMLSLNGCFKQRENRPNIFKKASIIKVLVDLSFIFPCFIKHIYRVI